MSAGDGPVVARIAVGYFLTPTDSALPVDVEHDTVLRAWQPLKSSRLAIAHHQVTTRQNSTRHNRHRLIPSRGLRWLDTLPRRGPQAVSLIAISITIKSHKCRAHALGVNPIRKSRRQRRNTSVVSRLTAPDRSLACIGVSFTSWTHPTLCCRALLLYGALNPCPTPRSSLCLPVGWLSRRVRRSQATNLSEKSKPQHIITVQPRSQAGPNFTPRCKDIGHCPWLV